MAYTKTKIYNLALSHLLLSQQVDEIETSTITNEVRVLNTFWEESFNITIQELDLDSLSEPIPLELLETLDEGPFKLVYKYPTRCSFLRRIISGAEVDTENTYIGKRTGLRNGLKVIFTNQEAAVAECIPNDFPLEVLSHSAALCISYMLASLASPLIVGKGAKKLKDDLFVAYLAAKSKAQEIDASENFNYEGPGVRSAFVHARMS